jgi:hypothetical protein
VTGWRYELTPPEVTRTIKLRLASEHEDDRASLDDLARSVAAPLGPAADARDEWMPGAARYEANGWLRE